MSKLINALILSASISHASWLSFNKVNFSQLSENKLILIKVTKDDCGYCDYMDEKVLDEKNLGSLLAKNFSLISVNISHEKMPFGLEARVAPSFYLIDKKLTIHKHLLGAWTKEDFLDIFKPYMKEIR